MMSRYLPAATRSWPGIAVAALALTSLLVPPLNANAGEAEAKQILKAMSDYVGAQKTISFDFDASLEVVTNCSVPDDHIDPRRRALFVARSILSEIWDAGRAC